MTKKRATISVHDTLNLNGIEKTVINSAILLPQTIVFRGLSFECDIIIDASGNRFLRQRKGASND